MESIRLRELMEASRPADGAEDDCGLTAAEALALRQAAEDPAIAAELARIHGWDAAIEDAMDDIPLPAGLADRLLTVVKQEQAAEPTVTKAAPVAEPSRRRWLAVALGTAAALLVAVGAWQWNQQPTELTAEHVQDLATELRQLAAGDAAWQEDISAAPLATHPLESSLRVAPWRWQRMATSLDAQAVVYDLSHTRRKTLLIVMQAKVASDELSTRPPSIPQATTGGVCVGMWQRDGLVYALVVEGNEPWYRGLVKNPLPTA
jgi:hypothetical protein